MAIIDTFKESPLKAAGATISGIAAILGSIWALDNHYASAADITEFKTSVQAEIKQIKVDTSLQTYQLRREMLRDKVDDLNIKEDSGKLSPYEVRQRQRYVDEIGSIDGLLSDVERTKLGITSKDQQITTSTSGQPIVQPMFKK